MRLKTWQKTPAKVPDKQSQLGEAMFYILGHQLAAFAVKVPPPPELCVYMADGNVCIH